ncbi:hypothetical protein Efla_003341 [Eimeria flavescens]
MYFGIENKNIISKLPESLLEKRIDIGQLAGLEGQNMLKNRATARNSLRRLSIAQRGVALLCVGAALSISSSSAAGAPSSFSAAPGAGGPPPETDFQASAGGEAAAAAFAASGALPKPWTLPSYQIQQEEEVGAPAEAAGAAAAGPRKSEKAGGRKPLLLASALGMIVALAGLAMRRKGVDGKEESRDKEETVKKLTELLPEARKLAEAGGAVDTTIPFKYLEGAVGVLEKTEKALKAVEDEKERQHQEKEFSLHVGESVAALRFIQKGAHEQAHELIMQAKEALPPSVPEDELGKVEATVLKADLVEAYKTLRLALEKSAKAEAALAEEGAANLKKIPLLACEDEASLIRDSAVHMGFTQLTGSNSKLAGKMIRNAELQMVVAHREMVQNRAVEDLTVIEEVHASLEAYRLLAEEALSSADEVQAKKLRAFIDSVQELEEEFQKLPNRFLKLRDSESISVNVQIASELTEAKGKFVQQREACMQAYQVAAPILEELEPSESFAQELLDAALSTALRGAKTDHKSTLSVLKTAREHRDKMQTGDFMGQQRPLVSVQVADSILEEMEKHEEHINAAFKAVQEAAGKGAEGLTATEAQEQLRTAYVSRQALAEIRTHMDHLNAQYLFLRSLEDHVELAFEIFDASRAKVDKEAHSGRQKEIDMLNEEFEAELKNAATATSLAEIATAIKNLREKADHFTKFVYHLDHPPEAE